MSNVFKFTKTVHRCDSAKEAESFFPLLADGTARNIHVVRNKKREWLVTVVKWKAERMTQDEINAIASELMAKAVANMRKEFGHVL